MIKPEESACSNHLEIAFNPAQLCSCLLSARMMLPGEVLSIFNACCKNLKLVQDFDCLGDMRTSPTLYFLPPPAARLASYSQHRTQVQDQAHAINRLLQLSSIWRGWTDICLSLVLSAPLQPKQLYHIFHRNDVPTQPLSASCSLSNKEQQISQRCRATFRLAADSPPIEPLTPWAEPPRFPAPGEARSIPVDALCAPFDGPADARFAPTEPLYDVASTTSTLVPSEPLETFRKVSQHA